MGRKKIYGRRRKRSQAPKMSNGTKQLVKLKAEPVEPVKEELLPENKHKEPHFEELTEEQLELYAENAWIVSLIQKGVPASMALTRLGIKRSERSVRRLVHRYKEQGYKGLIDKRWLRKTEEFILTPVIKKLILALYFLMPAAGNRLIWSKLTKECEERKLEIPSESSVTKFLNSLPEIYQLFRHGESGVKQWTQDHAPVIRYENTVFGNERWQADDSPLPIWVRVKIDGEVVPAVAQMTASLDAHSRSIPGYVLSTKKPDSWSISLMLRRAILGKDDPLWKNCGIPYIWQSDRGMNYLSNSIVATLKRLNVELDPDPPYYPNRKGKVERFFQTLDSGCLRGLPGHHVTVGVSEGAAQKRVHEFLTIQQLDAEVRRWITEEYHQRVHSETGRKPAELWQETVRLRIPASEDDLNLLLLKDDVERTVRNTGIALTFDNVRRHYWAPDLSYHSQRRVRLAYNPEDMESVLVYCAATGERLCEAFDMSGGGARYTIKDIKVTRNQFRRGLKERIKEYHKEIETEDRRALRTQEWREASEELEAEKIPVENELPEDPFDDADITRYMEEMRRRDRGEI